MVKCDTFFNNNRHQNTHHPVKIIDGVTKYILLTLLVQMPSV
jgi:hypothetical protein